MNKPYIQHHGVKGQKWGVRRYQNKDGTLTNAGKKRYGIDKLDASKRDDIKNLSSKEKYKSLAREKKELNKRIGEYEKDEMHKVLDESAVDRTKKGTPILDDKSMGHYGRETAKIEQATRQARVYVDQYLTSKYGKQLVDDYNKTQEDKQTVGLALGAIGGSVVAGLAAAGVAVAVGSALRK